MGAQESKPTGSSPHMWKGSSASPTASHDLVESLQSSPETDASRSRLSEAQIQARVSAELQKLVKNESSLLSKALADTSSNDSPANNATTANSPSRQSVSKELEALRAKLDERRQVRGVPENVANARSEVIRCLTEKDRRPLDCWQEVEAFKREVKNWEKGWVEKVTS